MKAVIATIFALSGLLATTLANPMVKPDLEARQYDVEGIEIDVLIAFVEEKCNKLETAAAAVPEDASEKEKQAAADKLAPDFKDLTDIFGKYTEKFTAHKWEKKGAACDAGCFRGKIAVLVGRVARTVKVLVARLGLACVLVYLKPLVLALSGLINCLALVIDGLLLAVKGILDDLLGGLSLGLLGLLPW